MPRDYEPIRDPYSDRPPRRYKAPKALRRLWKLFPYASQLYAFRQVFGREPESDDELDRFAEEYVIEAYNNGEEDPRMPGDPTAS